MENKEEFNYFVMFPSYLLDHLTPHECILMGVLISLSKMNGYAYPSNQMLMRSLRTSQSTINRMLAKLESDGYIKRHIIRNENGEVTSRRIYIQSSLVTPPHVENGNTLVSEISTPVLSELTIPSCHNQQVIVKEDNITTIKNDDIIKVFEHAWILYQKTGVKKTALTSFRRLTKDEMKKCIQHIPSYVMAHRDADKMDYLPHFSTYINQRRWNDSLPYQSKRINPAKGMVNWDAN